MTRTSAILVGVVAVAASVLALWRLLAAESGVEIAAFRVGDTPATLFAPADAAPSPVVVIAHGFSGSETLMRGYATTLARNGLRAVTFDFLGHGRHPRPLTGDVTREDGAEARLLEQVAEVTEAALALPGADGRHALLGHSMATDIIVRRAVEAPDADAVVAVSMFARMATAEAPRNLLALNGEFEGWLRAEALRLLRLTAGEDAAEGVTYGAFDGPPPGARRAAAVGWAEHIGVLYAPQAMAEARDWLLGAFGRAGTGYADARGPWILLLIAAVVALGWPLSRLLPRVSAEPHGAGLGWRRLWPATVIPAVATPLILWPLDLRFLPTVVGDYLAVHFGLYGVLTAVCLRLFSPGSLRDWRGFDRRALAVAAAAVAAYAVLAVGGVVDRWVTAFLPIPERWPLLGVMLLGTLPYFLAGEWLTRGPGAARGGYAVTKLLFLLSLAAATALNLERLFFLIILAPALVLFFLVFGLFSDWAYRATGHPFAGAIGNAVVFAVGIAAVFPMIAA